MLVPVYRCLLMVLMFLCVISPREMLMAGDMVFVPAGKFVFGEKKREPENLCKRDFHIAKRAAETGAFYIDRLEVTNAQYGVFVRATGHRAPRHWDGPEPPAGILSAPVTFVNCDDAGAYARWAGKRLPTEQEWEKAARSTDGRKFPWGNDKPTTRRAVFFRLWGEAPQPVGQCPDGASPYGCLDMAGNVCEWTSTSVKGTDERIVRGGDWANVPENLRTSRRTAALFDIRSGDLGFRCAADRLPEGATLWQPGSASTAAANSPPPDPHDQLQRPPRGVHPRLFFGPDDLPRIRKRITNSTAAKNSWSLLQNAYRKAWARDGAAKLYCETVLDRKRTGKTGAKLKQPPNMDTFSFTAFYHLIKEDEVSAKRTRRAALALARCAQQAGKAHYSLISHLALIYDLGFNVLSKGERAQVRKGLIRQCKLMAQLGKVSFFGLGRPSYYRAFDWCPLFLAPIGMAALVMEGEIDEAVRLEWERMATGAVRDYFQVGIGRDGGCLDGLAYLGFGNWNTGYLLDGLKLRGMDLYQHPHLKRLPEWLAHEVLPWRNQFNTFGKTHLRPAVGLLFTAMRRAYPDNKSMSWAWHNHGGFRAYTCIPLVVYGEPVPKADTSGFALSRHFRGRDTVIARTDWTTDAVHFATRYGREVHCQTDTSSFTLCGYGSFFVINPGMERLSEGHSITRIDGKGMGSSFSSTIGKIIDYRHGPFATLVHGDAAHAYNYYYPFEPGVGKKVAAISVKEASRYFAFVTGSGAPPYLMIKERLDKDGKDHDYQWLLQLSQGAECRVAGSTAAVTSPLHNERTNPPAGGTRNKMTVMFLGSPPVTLSTDIFAPNGTKTNISLSHPRLKADRRAVNADFTVLLYPHKGQMPAPEVTRQPLTNGLYVRLRWPRSVDHWLFANPDSRVSASGVESDGLMALVREYDGKVIGSLAFEATELRWQGKGLFTSDKKANFLHPKPAR